MELVKCDVSCLDRAFWLYHAAIDHLEKNTNYPKWSSEHPSDRCIEEAVTAGEQYLCIESNDILGAVVLSENPDGFYEAGNWSRELKTGEYLVIHALAVNPMFAHKGVGSFMVDQCIDIARHGGYKALRLDVVPGNIPAERLYEKMGFVYAGTKDLQRNIDEIPFFDLFEFVLF